jgi:hypothetical protein
MQRKHLLIGALIGVPILLGGGAMAFAASGGSSGSPAQTFIADVASHLGISTGTLESAMQQARLDQVQQMLSQGRITSAQATQMENAIKSGKLGFGRGFGPGMRGPGGRMMGGAGAMQAAASYLGLTPAQLRTDLGAGKSLSDIASATSGKTVQGLEAAITTAMQQDIQKAVSAGTMTQQQATARQQQLQTFVQQFVTRKGGAPGHGPWGPPQGAPQGTPPATTN